MKRFAELFTQLDQTTKTNEKIDALAKYFDDANPADAAWAVYFLTGRKLKRLVPTGLLRVWAAEQAGIEDWLFDDCYQAVGDLAETISLIVGDPETQTNSSLRELGDDVLPRLGKADEVAKHDMVLELWRSTDQATRFVMMKLITGAFRVGVSSKLVSRGLAKHSGLPADVIAHRLMGNWIPSEDFFIRLIDPDVQDTLVSQPYPFCLAHAVEPDAGPTSIGSPTDFAAEWKWDGIRGQVIRRSSQTFLWSRGEDLMENRWPEIESAAAFLPDGTVIDGEILASHGPNQVLPFAELQRRIGRKTVGKKLLREVPVIFHAFDALEIDGVDIRELSFRDRREKLEQLLSDIDHPHLVCTELINFADWESLATTRQRSREVNSEGIMLKRLDATYSVGRTRGVWWKWKVAPYTIDAVMIYAQQGHGRRAGLFTDYTFALWRDGELVPFAKAYSGLDNQEIKRVDRFVRQNTLERFGPVRSVKPELVFELAFEGLQKSTRHKSGIATRFPRILRWREDKRPEDANSLSDLLELLSDD